jgi:tetratricopeptide (TPR) repeat protein
LIGELHRRSVWQVLGSYAVVAWLVLQLAETLEGLIGLPLWFGPTVVIVVLLGFPVLLVTTLTQGGWKKKETSESWFHDSAEGGDEALSSWRSLEEHPVRDAFRRVFTWRNAVAGGALMAVLVVLGSAGYSGLRYAGIGPLGSLVAKGVFDPNEELILSDFEDRTTDGTLGETVTALFRIDLSQSTSLHLLERSEVAPALARMQLDPAVPLTHEVALELARREGVKALVAGEVLPLGSGAVVAARLVAAASGETLVALSETARTVDEVPDAVDRISAKMRERMGESLRSIQGDPPLVEVTTSSLEALRKYAEAEWASDMGDVATAEALVKEAIVLDSTFSMAYRKLGVLLSNDERDGDEARNAFTKAFEGRERLPDRERLLAEAAYHTYVTKDLDAAVRAYERVLALHPSDGIAGNNLAVLYGELDQPDKAAALYLRAIERGHAPAVAYANAVSTLFEMGQVDSAQAILAGFRDRYPGHPQAIQYAAALASAEFQYDRADSLARGLMVSQEGVPRWEMWGEVELATHALVRGKVKEGAARMMRAHGLQDRAGTRFTQLPRPVFEALGRAAIQLHFLGDPAGTVRILDGAISGWSSDSVAPEKRGQLEFASLYSESGRPDRARERIAAFRKEVPTEEQESDEVQSALRSAEAGVALAEGRPEEAVRLYKEARAMAPKCTFCSLPELGEAFEAGAMPDSAVAVYDEYLGLKDLFRSQQDNLNLPRVLLGLGRSWEAMGRPDRAAVYYRRLLTLWADPDPELAPRVMELRSKVEQPM